MKHNIVSHDSDHGQQNTSTIVGDRSEDEEDEENEEEEKEEDEEDDNKDEEDVKADEAEILAKRACNDENPTYSYCS